MSDEDLGPKTCRYTGHVIDEENDRGYAFYRLEDGTMTHACFAHALTARVREYRRDRIITSKLHMDAHLRTYRPREETPWWANEIAAGMRGVDALVKQWERAVWFGGAFPDKDDAVSEPIRDLSEWRQYRDDAAKHLAPKGSLQAFVLGAAWSGYHCDVGGYKYLSFTSAGRAMFQIERKGSGDYVSIISDETSPMPRSGLQGICATAENAKRMLHRAISDWQAGKIVLVHKKDVGVL